MRKQKFLPQSFVKFSVVVIRTWYTFETCYDDEPDTQVIVYIQYSRESTLLM